MNILILEDQGGVFDYLVEELEDEQHVVFAALNIPKAKYYWREGKIDCIVADSNMPPDGLTKQQAKETQGGLLGGWVWLKHYVFKNEPSMRKRTVIVTAYLDELTERVAKDELEGIRGVVSKRRLGEFDTNMVLDYVRDIKGELADGTRGKKAE